MDNAIHVDGLKKSYGNHEVLKGISFDVKKGEVFALLGVNGAGKTTTLECVEGLRKYDTGSILVNGKTGIQLQSSSLPSHIKPMEAINLFAKWNHAKIDFEMIQKLGINELAKKKYVDMSTGQKRRLHLALALISNPDIVFLDEPTAGLDVEGRVSLHEQIRLLKKQGKTIVLASHDMAEVETLCDRIAVLNKGSIFFVGTVEELTKKLGKRYSIHIKTVMGEETFASENIGESMLTILEDFKRKNVSVLDIKVEQGTLEQYLIEIARGIKS